MLIESLNINGAKTDIIEWADGYFSIQMDPHDFKVLDNLKKTTNMIEEYILKEKQSFYKHHDKMELMVESHSDLYLMLKNKKTKELI